MTPITRNSIGIDGEVFEERRKEPRRRVLKGATLSFNRGYGARWNAWCATSRSTAQGWSSATPPRSRPPSS